MLRVDELYEKQVRLVLERPDGSEYTNFKKVYEIRSALINKNYIVSIHPHEFSSPMDLKMMEGRFAEGTQFSSLVLDGNSFRTSEVIVVGSFAKYCTLLEEPG